MGPVAADSSAWASSTDEDALEKKGAELFRELLRVYCTAEAEDYIKGGTWNDELMKNDLIMIQAHRREAGAPEPPSLEAVKMPELPKIYSAASLTGVRPVLPASLGVRPVGLIGGVRPPAAGAPNAAAGGAVAELRLIALFVAKWKLDPTKTKTMLAKMTAQRRRYVIQNFKTASTGAEATTALETYIAECQTSGVWDTAAPATGGTAPIATTTTAPAVKPSISVPKPVAVAPKAAVVAPKAAMVAPKAGALRPGIPPGGTAPAAATAAAGVKRPIAAVTAPAQPGPGKWATTVRPGVVAPAGRPVAPAARPVAVAPKAKAGQGDLIRNLLTKF